MGNSNQSNLENVERIRDKRGWSGYFGVEGKQHVLLRLCTSTPMKTARIRGGGGQHTCPPDHDLPNTAVRRNFVGGGGKFFNNNVEHCKQILRTKIERFGAYLGYFFHLNDYETKIHYFKNFGGGGTRAPAPPPPLRTAMLPKKNPVPYILSPLHHIPSPILSTPMDTTLSLQGKVTMLH